jgi:hypothetical protein
MITSLWLSVVVCTFGFLSQQVYADASWGPAAACFGSGWALDDGPIGTYSNCDPDGFCSGGVDTLYLTVYGAGSQDNQNGEYTIHYDPHFPPGWSDDGSSLWQLGSKANPNCILDFNGDISILSYKLDVNEFSCTLATWTMDRGNGDYHFDYQSATYGPDEAGHAYEVNLPGAVSMVCFYCWGDGVYTPNC